MGNAQRAGGVAAYIDAEHALDIEYARKLGVDVDNLLISQPDTGEQALEICEILVRSGAVDVVVIDSVAALVPKAEIEGEMGDSHMGLQARLMSQALRKLAGAINRSGTAVVFINQLREKIGVMFGNPETTTGGRALKFYASVRLDVRRIAPVKDREVVIGSHVRVKVVKNKVAPPFRQAEFDIMYDEGISHAALVLDIASEAGIIQKSGAWFGYNDQRIGQGRENAKMFLKDNPAVLAEVEVKVRELLGMKQGAAEEEAVAEEWVRLVTPLEPDARGIGGRARPGGRPPLRHHRRRQDVADPSVSSATPLEPEAVAALERRAEAFSGAGRGAPHAGLPRAAGPRDRAASHPQGPHKAVGRPAVVEALRKSASSTTANSPGTTPAPAPVASALAPAGSWPTSGGMGVRRTRSRRPPSPTSRSRATAWTPAPCALAAARKVRTAPARVCDTETARRRLRSRPPACRQRFSGREVIVGSQGRLCPR